MWTACSGRRCRSLASAWRKSGDSAPRISQRSQTILDVAAGARYLELIVVFKEDNVIGEPSRDPNMTSSWQGRALVGCGLPFIASE
jgi:hypothetical protein